MAVNTDTPFVHEDETGPYQICTEWHIDGDGIGQVCEGRMRPTDDGDRWRCPDCGATIGRGGDIRTDGGPRFGPEQHDLTPDLPEEPSEVERVEAAVDLAVEAVDRGDDPRPAAEWACGRVDLGMAWLVGVHQRVLERVEERGDAS
jgi:predicted RNA-binding Zn-ribbon protein involved in translation (DUF1610 family)